jgi:hypothetical protein
MQTKCHTLCIWNSYDTIEKCWEKAPDARPHFSELENILSTLLGKMAGYFDISATTDIC